ncbi:hypothetical protein [Lusitaniella coriacea]|uniref:hypothetical protein n=1 Tax=Lusitaniella coriacea TaxID=1983105 RepID=UPI003CEF583D
MSDPFQEKRLKHLQMYLYFVPVAGIFPALWTLVRKGGDREQRSASRLAITLALTWFLAYSLLSTGATQTTELLKFRLLFIDGLLTSGYFLTCLGLMLRVWRRKSPRLPGISKLAERTMGKHSS